MRGRFLAAATFALSFAYQAEATDLGALSGTITSGSATSGGPIDDIYNFSTLFDGSTAILSQSVTFSNFGVTISDLSLYIGRYNNTSDLAGLTPLNALWTSGSTALGGGIVALQDSGGAFLTADTDYTLLVTGSSRGASAYSLIISAPTSEDASSVPEPAYGLRSLAASV